MDNIDIVCPNCYTKIHMPFFRDVKAQAIERADLAEREARKELLELRFWLADVSLFGLIKFWLKRR